MNLEQRIRRIEEKVSQKKRVNEGSVSRMSDLEYKIDTLQESIIWSIEVVAKRLLDTANKLKLNKRRGKKYYKVNIVSSEINILKNLEDELESLDSLFEVQENQ